MGHIVSTPRLPFTAAKAHPGTATPLRPDSATTQHAATATTATATSTAVGETGCGLAVPAAPSLLFVEAGSWKSRGKEVKPKAGSKASSTHTVNTVSTTHTVNTNTSTATATSRLRTIHASLSQALRDLEVTCRKPAPLSPSERARLIKNETERIAALEAHVGALRGRLARVLDLASPASVPTGTRVESSGSGHRHPPQNAHHHHHGHEATFDGNICPPTRKSANSHTHTPSQAASRSGPHTLTPEDIEGLLREARHALGELEALVAAKYTLEMLAHPDYGAVPLTPTRGLGFGRRGSVVSVVSWHGPSGRQ